MTEPAANTTRAALEAARVALGRMTGAPGAPGAARAVPVTMAVRASDAWKSAEILLRLLVARPDLGGQPLLAEARRVDKLDMEGMHALVAMREWLERTLAPGSAAQMLTLPPTDAEREVANNALAALERSMGDRAPSTAAASTPTAPLSVAASTFAPPSASSSALPTPIPSQPGTSSTSQWAPQATGDVRSTSNRDKQLENPFLAGERQQQSRDQARVMPENTVEATKAQVEAERARRASDATVVPVKGNFAVSSGFIMAMLLLVLVIGGGGTWYALRGKSPSSSLTQEGVDAYTRGAKEAARISLAKAVEQNPQDVRALTYLGRVAREQGDLATSRRYLEAAIRVEPNNELALRELASALLADNEFELARRFYARALKVDATDRIAQGFLACALAHLNRTEEAARWLQRAGPGDWSSCATTGTDPPAKD